MWYVYVLKCSDDTYYTGITAELRNRVDDHNRGKGSKYTKTRRPVQLIYFEKLTSRTKTAVREIEIKKLSRKNKERLIKYGKGVRVSLASNILRNGGSGLRTLT